MYASILVTSWNRPQLLWRCLEQLWSRTQYPYELIIHDDGSSPELTKRLHQAIDAGKISTLILNPPGHNRGNGTSTNRAFAMSSGDYIIKLDGDEVFAENWLTKAIEAMEKFPEIILLHLSYYFKSARREDKIEKVIWDLDPFTLYVEERDGTKIRVVWVGPGEGFIVRRKDWIPWKQDMASARAICEDVAFRTALCPMMRITREKPDNLAEHWNKYKNSPWLGVIDPPVVSFHPGNALNSIRDAVHTLSDKPVIL